MRFPTPVFQMPDAPTSPAPSAGTSAPASTPSSAPATTPSAAPSTSLPNVATPSTPPLDSAPSADAVSSSFEFMFGPEGGDPLEGPGLSPPTTVTPEPKPAQPAQAEPVKPAATASEPAKPDPGLATPAPTEATSPTPQAQPEQPNLDPYDPGTLAAHLAQNEEQVVQHVADNLFKLSDKDVEELESNTVGAIPKLLARSFVAAQKNFLMQLATLVPRMVQAHGEVTKRHSEAEGEFYSRWPDLKKDQAITMAGKPTTIGNLVMSYAAVFRQMNPQASRKDAIEAVGPMVMMAAGVTPSVPGQTQQPQAQTSPMAPTNGARQPQPSPFVPAGPSAAGAVPTTRPELNPVEALFVGPEAQ